jgi:hypothetical protein
MPHDGIPNWWKTGVDEGNPKLRAAVRRLVQKIAENIDPDVTVEKVNIGEGEKP